MSDKFFVFTERDGVETLVQASSKKAVDNHFNEGRTVRRAKESDTIRLISTLVVIESAGVAEAPVEGTQSANEALGTETQEASE